MIHLAAAQQIRQFAHRNEHRLGEVDPDPAAHARRPAQGGIGDAPDDEADRIRRNRADRQRRERMVPAARGDCLACEQAGEEGEHLIGAAAPIGDSVNDASMLRWAGRGIAMPHSDRYARAAADEILGGTGIAGLVPLLHAVLDQVSKT